MWSLNTVSITQLVLKNVNYHHDEDGHDGMVIALQEFTV